MTNNIAIFWDYENFHAYTKGINIPIAEAILEYSKSLGHIQIKRAYSDWIRVDRDISQSLYSLGFEPIQVSMGKANSADIKIAVDCLDTAFVHPTISHFLIMTGDKDFIPVVNWLRAHEKEVIIIAKSSHISDHLILAANKYISLEELLEIHDKKISLPDDEPQKESKISHMLTLTIKKEDWKLIFELIKKSILEKEDKVVFTGFLYLQKILTHAKKDGIIDHSHKTLKSALSKSVDIGYLITLPNGTFQLADDHETNLNSYIKKAMKRS